jgi:tetratricopeptide (TPR) repeat protein
MARLLDEGERRERRLMLVGLAAGASAYLVQANFNIEQPALAATFWIFLGLLCALARDATATASSQLLEDESAGPRNAPATPRWIVATVGVVVAVIVAVLATAPYRASGTRSAASQNRFDLVETRYAAADKELKRAVDLEPFESLFLESRAEFIITAPRASVPQDEWIRELRVAEDLLKRAQKVDPKMARITAWYGTVVGAMADATKNDSLYLDQIDLFRQATEENPRVPEYALSLSFFLFNRGDKQGALDAITRSLSYNSEYKSLLDAQAAIRSGKAPTFPGFPPIRDPIS